MVKSILKNRRSILYSWFVSYICVLLVPILIGIYLYNSAYSVIRKTTGEVYEASLGQAVLEMDNQIREANAILGQLLGDEDVQRLTAVKGSMSTDEQLILITMTGRLQKLVMNHPSIEDIYILFGESSSVVSTKGHMSGELFSELYLDREKDQSDFDKLFEKLSETRAIVTVKGKDGKDKLLFHKKTLDTGLGHSTAVIGIQIDSAKLLGRLYDSEDTHFMVLDKTGGIVASTGEYDEIIANRQKYESISRESAVTDWTYVYIISTGIYEASARSIQIKTIIGLLICMILGIVISINMSRRNYNPIKHLLEITGAAAAMGIETGNEYDLLKRRVNNLYNESKVIGRELYQNNQTLKNLKVFSLINASAMNMTEGDEIVDDMGLSGLGNTVVLFRNPYLDASGTVRDGDEKNYELLQSVLVNIFEEIAGEHFGVVSTTAGVSVASVISLLPGNDISEDNWKDVLSADIRKMQEVINEYLHLWVDAGVGNLHIGTEEIHQAYLEAKDALKAEYALNSRKSNNNSNEMFCQEIRDYISANYTDPDLNISQAAIHFGITPSYMSKIFKMETGKSLLAYISEVRICAAKELLEEGKTIAQVAEEAGFRDSAALIRIFKKNVGMTPGQFREIGGFSGFENSF